MRYSWHDLVFARNLRDQRSVQPAGSVLCSLTSEATPFLTDVSTSTVPHTTINFYYLWTSHTWRPLLTRPLFGSKGATKYYVLRVIINFGYQFYINCWYKWLFTYITGLFTYIGSIYCYNTLSTYDRYRIPATSGLHSDNYQQIISPNEITEKLQHDVNIRPCNTPIIYNFCVITNSKVMFMSVMFQKNSV
jgi:hypothetical protein